MKNKLKILSVPLLVLVFLWMTDPYSLDLDTLGFILGPVVLACVILFFVKKEAINPWWYFSLAFWSFVALKMFTTEKGGGTFGLGDGSLMAVGFFAWIYLLLSLAIIAVKSWKLWGK